MIPDADKQLCEIQNFLGKAFDLEPNENAENTAEQAIRLLGKYHAIMRERKLVCTECHANVDAITDEPLVLCRTCEDKQEKAENALKNDIHRLREYIDALMDALVRFGKDIKEAWAEVDEMRGMS